MNSFITGGTGFVGKWLQQHLQSEGDAVVVADDSQDIRDPDIWPQILTDAAPDVIYHLAAIADVGASWREPKNVYDVNVGGTLNILNAARQLAHVPRVIVVSSAEVYGVVKAEELPITEDTTLRPVSPYAGSKVGAEYAALQAFHGWGVPVVIARPFNHIGPGQSPAFFVSAMGQRIVQAQRENKREISVGNLTARRDFTDVRDVVRAYRLLAEHAEAGTVYNVCSGTDVAVADVVDELLAIADFDGTLVPDSELMRPVDLPVMRGSCARLKAVADWQPTIGRTDTLADVIAYWQAQP